MNREQQEMSLWRCEYVRSTMVSVENRAAEADAAVAEFRKRYPVEPTAPEPTAPELAWYDDPPFEKDGRHRACWVAGESHVQSVYWSIAACGWRYCQPHVSGPYPLYNRRVCPIVKPPEPPQ